MHPYISLVLCCEEMLGFLQLRWVQTLAAAEANRSLMDFYGRPRVKGRKNKSGNEPEPHSTRHIRAADGSLEARACYVAALQGRKLLQALIFLLCSRDASPFITHLAPAWLSFFFFFSHPVK